MAIRKYEDRLIGFFDVLGFSRLLENSPIDDLHRDYSALIDESNSRVFEQESLPGSPEPRVSNFAKSQFLFDSVVVVSHPTNDVGNICRFVLASLLLIEKALERKFFLRGCISGGEFLDDPDRNIFLSSQFPRLVNAEKNQEWCGCYVHENVETAVLDSIFGSNFVRSAEFSPTRHMPLIPYDVPLKGNGTQTRWCLNWVSMTDRPVLQSMLPLLISPKRENSERFAQYVHSLQDDSLALPAVARPAVSLSVMKTRGSARVKFSDENGCGTDPGGPAFSLQFIENG